MKLTKEQLAARLDGREYMNEITKQDEADAKESGLVIVFGYSDDNMEIAGAWGRDEFPCYRGKTWGVDSEGIIPTEDEEERNSADSYRRQKAKHGIEAIWCPDESLSWAYTISAPYVTFNITEEGQPYCRGIVFAVEDIK